MAEKAGTQRKHRSRKRRRVEWWSELKHGEAILRGLRRFEKEGRARKAKIKPKQI